MDKTLKHDKATYLELFCRKCPTETKQPHEPFPLLLVGTKEGGICPSSAIPEHASAIKTWPYKVTLLHVTCFLVLTISAEKIIQWEQNDALKTIN